MDYSSTQVYTVFHEESESEVEKYGILEPGGKKFKNSTENFLINILEVPFIPFINI